MLYLNSYETFRTLSPGCVSYLLISGERKNCFREQLFWQIASQIMIFLWIKKGCWFLKLLIQLFQNHFDLFAAIKISLHVSRQILILAQIFLSSFLLLVGSLHNCALCLHSKVICSSSSTIWGVRKQYSSRSSECLSPCSPCSSCMCHIAQQISTGSQLTLETEKEGYNSVKSEHLLEP